MNYITRCAEDELEELSRTRAAVLVAGPRQVGKTTLLEKFTSGLNFVSFSNSAVAELAMNHGQTFLEDNKPPLFIDEVQKVPSIFENIKFYIDKEKRKGLFYLCGSQQIDVMKGVTESLSGRIGLINLLGFSLRELYGFNVRDPFVPTDEYLSLRKDNTAYISYDDVWHVIHRGSMPELCTDQGQDWKKFYEDYLTTYIERDVKEIINVRNNAKFGDFLRALSARCGQILNVAALAKNVGINVQTAENWLSVLINCKIIYLLRPYYNNLLKRLTKTPKVYFLDTGILAYLCDMMTAKEIQSSSMRGAVFENFVISEIIKSYYNKGHLNPPLYYYRDADQKEIDLIISDGDTLHPVEIKSFADPRRKDISSFSVLNDIPGKKRGDGGVICLSERLMTLDIAEGTFGKTRDMIIPLTYV